MNSEAIQVLVTKDLKESVKLSAKRNGRTLSDEVRWLLRLALAMNNKSEPIHH